MNENPQVAENLAKHHVLIANDNVRELKQYEKGYDYQAAADAKEPGINEGGVDMRSYMDQRNKTANQLLENVGFHQASANTKHEEASKRRREIDESYMLITDIMQSIGQYKRDCDTLLDSLGERVDKNSKESIKHILESNIENARNIMRAINKSLDSLTDFQLELYKSKLSNIFELFKQIFLELMKKNLKYESNGRNFEVRQGRRQ